MRSGLVRILKDDRPRKTIMVEFADGRGIGEEWVAAHLLKPAPPSSTPGAGSSRQSAPRKSTAKKRKRTPSPSTSDGRGAQDSAVDLAASINASFGGGGGESSASVIRPSKRRTTKLTAKNANAASGRGSAAPNAAENEPSDVVTESENDPEVPGQSTNIGTVYFGDYSIEPWCVLSVVHCL